MKQMWSYRIGAAVLLYLAILTPASAAYTSLYAGLQADNASGSALLGYQINKAYAVEAFYIKTDTHIDHSGITSDTNISTAGLALLGMIPMKMTGNTPYILFVKAGYQRSNKEQTYTIPSSVTLTLPYQDKISSSENRVIFGAGVQYDFYQSMSGRAGIDIAGDQRSVYLGAIFKF